MFAVTYIPRLIPFLLGQKLQLPGWVQRWLKYFSYAALGALIFPGILSIDPDRPWIGLSGGVFAALFSLIIGNVTAVVAASIVFMIILERIIH